MAPTNAAAILQFHPISVITTIFLTSAPFFYTWLYSDLSAYQNITYFILAEEFSENDTECCVFVIFLILPLRPDYISVLISSPFITILLLPCSIAVCRSCSEETS